MEYIRIRNFRPHKDTEDVHLTNLNAIIGKNDSGKSSILYAIDIFLNRERLEPSDICKGIVTGENTVIEIEFRDAPDDLVRKRLLNKLGHLTLQKAYDNEGKRVSYRLQAYDFTIPDFQNLWSKREQELNSLGEKYSLEFTKSGRSITNESKIDVLTEYANQQGITMDNVWFEVEGENKKLIDVALPPFHFFSSEVSLQTNAASFQKPFQDTIKGALEQDNVLKSGIETRVADSVKKMKIAIEENLKEETDTVESIELVSEFGWQKLVSIGIEVIDNSGLRIPLENRGSGLRRLVMTSFLKYRSETLTKSDGGSAIYGIEEPETSLHPGAQRVLLGSLILLYLIIFPQLRAMEVLCPI